jgi:hypothetical protein
VGERNGRDDLLVFVDLRGRGDGAGARLEGAALISMGLRAKATVFSVGGIGGGPGL